MKVASGGFLSPDNNPNMSVKNEIFEKKHVFKAPRSRNHEHNALFESLTASMVKIEDSKHDLFIKLATNLLVNRPVG